MGLKEALPIQGGPYNGLMRAVRRSNFEPRLEMMPLLDVVFLLLTFFISSFVVMIRADTRGVTLAPVAGMAGDAAPTGAVRLLVLQADGELTFDGDLVAPGALDAVLEGLARGDSDETLYVSLAQGEAKNQAQGGQADRAGTLWTLLQQIDRAGLQKVVLVGAPSGERSK